MADEPILLLTQAGLRAIWDRTESWRRIPRFPYEVSSWGRVRRIGGGILKASPNCGYLVVCLSKHNHRRNHLVHLLVARIFLGPPPFEGANCAHNDGKPLKNNRASNLRWATVVENCADTARHGTKVQGSDVHCAKLTEADIPGIRRRLIAGASTAPFCRKYGISRNSLWRLKHRKSWKHVA